jgi:hypothetical protein
MRLIGGAACFVPQRRWCIGDAAFYKVEARTTLRKGTFLGSISNLGVAADTTLEPRFSEDECSVSAKPEQGQLGKARVFRRSKKQLRAVC